MWADFTTALRTQMENQVVAGAVALGLGKRSRFLTCCSTRRRAR